MQDFQLYVDDDRYTVVSLRFLTVASVERARELAEQVLVESPHPRGIELCQTGAHIWSKGSLLYRDQPRRTRAVGGG